MPKTLKRIMHVDDDVIIQKITGKSLESLGGFEVKAYGSGQAALDDYNSFRPDLILIDMIMPEMEGPEALHSLRERMSVLDVPVIFVTGREIEQIDLDDVTMGVIGVIKKPYKPQEVVDQVNTIWTQHYS